MPKVLHSKSAEKRSRYQLALDEAARKAILGALVESGGIMAETARALEVTQRTLYREVDRLALWEKVEDTCDRMGFERPRGFSRKV